MFKTSSKDNISSMAANPSKSKECHQFNLADNFWVTSDDEACNRLELAWSLLFLHMFSVSWKMLPNLLRILDLQAALLHMRLQEWFFSTKCKHKTLDVSTFFSKTSEYFETIFKKYMLSFLSICQICDFLFFSFFWFSGWTLACASTGLLRSNQLTASLCFSSRLVGCRCFFHCYYISVGYVSTICPPYKLSSPFPAGSWWVQGLCTS